MQSSRYSRLICFPEQNFLLLLMRGTIIPRQAKLMLHAQFFILLLWTTISGWGHPFITSIKIDQFFDSTHPAPASPKMNNRSILKNNRILKNVNNSKNPSPAHFRVEIWPLCILLFCFIQSCSLQQSARLQVWWHN